MPTTPDDALPFLTWLDSWWYLTSEWLEDPYPVAGDTPSVGPPTEWDQLACRCAALPDEWEGVRLTPLKDLFFAMLSFGAESKEYGSSRTPHELRDIGSKAWRAKFRFETVRGEAARAPEPVAVEDDNQKSNGGPSPESWAARREPPHNETVADQMILLLKRDESIVSRSSTDIGEILKCSGSAVRHKDNSSWKIFQGFKQGQKNARLVPGAGSRQYGKSVEIDHGEPG